MNFGISKILGQIFQLPHAWLARPQGYPGQQAATERSPRSCCTTPVRLVLEVARWTGMIVERYSDDTVDGRNPAPFVIYENL